MATERKRAHDDLVDVLDAMVGPQGLVEVVHGLDRVQLVRVAGGGEHPVFQAPERFPSAIYLYRGDEPDFGLESFQGERGHAFIIDVYGRLEPIRTEPRVVFQHQYWSDQIRAALIANGFRVTYLGEDVVQPKAGYVMRLRALKT